MAMAHEFTYYKPRNPEKVLKLLAQYRTSARILAGGTDLVNNIKENVISPEAIIDIKGITEWQKIELSENVLRIGALVTFSDLIKSSVVREYFPLIIESAKTVASAGIRNRATLIGNICSAVPSLDSGPALLVYEATITVLGQNGQSGQREIPIDQWFTGPKKTALGDDELAVGLSIPLLKQKHFGCYLKLGRYRGEDLAQAGVGILALEKYQYRVAFCALGPVPSRSLKIESLLNSNELTDALIKNITDNIENEISPISDIRASKEYRIHMVKVMMERGLKRVRARQIGQKTNQHQIPGELICKKSHLS